MEISIIIPAYRRPEDLKRCITACINQTKKAKEIIVTVRDFDKECQAVVKEFQAKNNIVNMVVLDKAGQMLAWYNGVKNARGDIVSFNDDDAEPFPDWLEKIEEGFNNDKVGGVGGYIINYINRNKINCFKRKVGKLLWFGRMLGHFHCNVPFKQEVDTLRGANMSFRRHLLTREVFDFNLKGREYRNDTQVSMAVKRKGYKLIYNPEIKVNHYTGEQFLEGGRVISKEEVYSCNFNTVYILMKYLKGFKRLFFIIFTFLYGQDDSVGIGRWLKFIIIEKQLCYFYWLKACMRGKIDGLKHYLKWKKKLC